MSKGPVWEKSSVALVERFGVVLDRHAGPGVTTRKMFGYPCAFVNGNMATGLFGEGWFARLPADEVAGLVASGRTFHFSPMPGRPMRDYATIPADVLADDAALDDWVARSLAFTRTLPPK
jgi:TfoX/Sxy family transcriptional regulator of competence genes